MKNIFLTHPHETDNPQGYWEHGIFSIANCLVLIWFSLLRIIHGICPFMFKFSTSSAIIRSFKRLVLSNRHADELEKYGLGRIDFRAVNNLLKKRSGGTHTPKI